jgi:hypothetical protein
MLLLLSLLACSQNTPPTSTSEKAPAEQTAEVTPDAKQPQPEVANAKPKAAPAPKKNPSIDHIYISEVMAFPSKVDKFRGEWIELSNPTAEAISLDGYSLHSKEDTGIVFEAGTSIPPNGSLLLAVRKSPTGNGGLPKVDVVYNHDVLKINATDWLELKKGTEVIDRQDFEKGDLPKGKSLQIMPDKSRCAAASAYGDGDLGTPNKANKCS